ncbi:MAG TPA: YifB family Mg chelatase-like AAA ATPase [Microbacteriaceae bacterium]|nr:YifB family Mg chelatase-like AAA ATPase [Microbacteriaceae bacterium]
MSVARTWAVTLNGLRGTLVEVEADITAGLPFFTIIGLPDAALAEARDRVRAAAVNSGCALTTHKLTVNLSPASVPKHGAGFDLAVALAALAAGGAVRPDAVAGVVHIGELGLDGRLRPTAGVLPAVLAARRSGFHTVMVPTANAGEAALVPGIEIVAVPSLREAAIRHGAELEPVPVEPLSAPVTPVPTDTAGGGDLAEIIGNPDAVRALQIAAAGGHHLFLLGPPGAGKTMLASRLPGLLPDLDDAEALEVTSVASILGEGVGGRLARRPPFQAPHHATTVAAMVGGGSGGRIRPGAATRAAHGVLFLDEAPEFPRAVLDSLRECLESGRIAVHRADAVAYFPGRFQLVLAANPCPCGNYGTGRECSCAPNARRRYLARLSGPLLDRVDMRLCLDRVTVAQLRLGAGDRPVTSAAARARVTAARAAMAERLAGTGWRTNSEVPGSWLRARPRRLAPSATAPLDRALERGVLTMRGYDRVLRLAWSVADFDGVTRPGPSEVGAALYFRGGAL